METISLKLDKTLLKNIDKNLSKHNFSTRTEFIRTAIRDKLEGLTKEELIKEFLKFKGASGKLTTEKEYERIREQAIKEIAKERGWDY